MTTYAELRLRIDRGVARGSYRIVATGPAGEALGRFKLPFSEIELENFILKVGTTRRGRRRIESPEMELAKNFGAKLFGALFEGDVRELYRSSFAETRSAGRGLRITLALTGAPELLQVPWEYMYDHPSFLSISTWTPIVRYLDLPKPRRPLQIELPLRILALVSAPVDAEPIDVQQERTKLEGALAPLIGMGAIAIDWLEEASLSALQRQLRKEDYHVFHYIGHGGYDQDADDGVLLFEDEHGRGRRVSGIQLGTILADEVSLRLAVLNSCEGGRSSLQDPFSGVATSLIEREIPAVIGMQFEITDRAAIVFAGEFYSALADGLPVDSSVAEARKAIYADQNDIEWGTPVLFMRVADGRLFDVQAHAPVRPPEPEPLVASDEVGAAEEETARQEAALRLEAKEAEEGAQRERAAAAEAERIEADRAEHEHLQREAAESAERDKVAAAEAERAEEERVQHEAAEVAERERAAAADAGAGIAAAALPGEPDTTIADKAQVAAGPSSGIQPGLALAGCRAALGGVLTAVIGDVLYVIGNSWAFEYAVKGFVSYAVLLATAMVAVVTLAEGLWPAVRVPGGGVYRSVGGSRWAASAIQGAFMGATVGLVVTVWRTEDSSLLSLEWAVGLALSAASGFVIAEAVLDRLFRRRPDEPTRA